MSTSIHVLRALAGVPQIRSYTKVGRTGLRPVPASPFQGSVGNRNKNRNNAPRQGPATAAATHHADHVRHERRDDDRNPDGVRDGAGDDPEEEASDQRDEPDLGVDQDPDLALHLPDDLVVRADDCLRHGRLDVKPFRSGVAATPPQGVRQTSREVIEQPTARTDAYYSRPRSGNRATTANEWVDVTLPKRPRTSNVDEPNDGSGSSSQLMTHRRETLLPVVERRVGAAEEEAVTLATVGLLDRGEHIVRNEYR